MTEPTQSTWAAALLRRLKIHQTPGAVKALTGWANAEGGNWHNDARYNPLNTTQDMPGAGNTGSQGNIKQYKDWGQGLDATVKTLENGNYDGIIHALHGGDPNSIANAIGETPWGTNAGLVRKAIASTPLVAGVHAFDVPGSSQAPAPSNVQRIASTSPSTLGSTPATPSTPSVFDVIASYRANTAPQASIAGTAGISSPYDPVASGQQIQQTVQRIQALRAPAQSAMQTGDAHASGISADRDAPAAVAQLIEEADRINSRHMPYVWGGGHAVSGKADRGTGRDPGVGLDCSGAVSAVLGIDPRVSGDFMNWGQSGEGKNVTVYANGHHVLMKINGHFFGTSESNPGGGAGWIPQKVISKDYLKQFTVRHPKGM
jgi:hypothetical protein